MNRTAVLSLGITLFSTTTLLSCSGDSAGPEVPPPDPNAVASVSVTVGSATIHVGETAQCTAMARNSSGQTVSATLTWSSSNASVATVDPHGLVTAVAEGSATIRASAGGVSGTGQITVLRVPVASVAVTPASASVVEHETVQLAATPLDDSGATLSGRAVTWSTSDAAVASVDSAGLVTGVAPGAATVTATSEGKTGTAAITVEAAPVASVVVTPDSATVILGHAQAFAAEARDAQGRALAGRSFIWTTADSAVATVNAQGVVTGVEVGGTTVTATSEGKSGSATVTVVPVPVASITVEPAGAEVPEGRTLQLTATTRDEDGNVLEGRSVTWSSSDEGVATVDQDGLVSGVAVGTATITATSEGKSGTAAVTVVPLPVYSVSVSPSNPAVVEGDTVRLTATAYDDAGGVLTGRDVTWSSADEAVATVDASGLVTGIAIGETTITAASEGVSGTVSVSVVGSLSVDWYTFSGRLTWSYGYRGGVLSSGTTYKYFEVEAGSADVALTATRDGSADTLTATTPVQQGRRYKVALAVGFSGSTRVGAMTTCAKFRFSSPQASSTTTSSMSGIYHPAAGWWDTDYFYCPTSYGLNSLTVTNAVETVTVSPASATIQVGQTAQLTATRLDADGVEVSGYTTWKSSSTAVATVSRSGKVTAKSPGTVTITASSEGRSGTAQVTVTPGSNQAPSASITSPADGSTHTAGTAVGFAGTGNDPEEGELTGGALVWVSSADGRIGTGTSFTRSDLSVGSHTVTLTATDAQGQVGADTVTLTVTPAATDAWEPDDDSGQANSIASGDRQVHDINPAGDEDWVTFTLAAPSAVMLETQGQSGDTYMTLYDSQLNVIEEDDDDGENQFSWMDRDCGTDELPPGTYFVKVTGTDVIDDYELSFLGMTCDAGFDIELKFVGDVTPSSSQRQAIENAAARWQELIVGDVEDAVVDWSSAGTCGGVDRPPLFQMIDDFLMLVQIGSVDGAGGSLGTAGACGYLPSLNHPGIGGLVLDQADLAQLEADGTLKTVVLHYMGHALGFGSSWKRAGLLQDASDTTAGGTVGADTYFSGSGAIAAFDAVGGSGYAGAKVPVENDQSRFGTGELDRHWRESVFGSELMSTELDPTNAPASVVTVRSLEDLGYEVDAAAADAFTLPTSLLRQAGHEMHLLRFGSCVREGPLRLLRKLGGRE